MFAYTNRDVDALNAELRQVRRDRGELAGRDVSLETRHGRAVFAVGDRVQFTDTDKTRHSRSGSGSRNPSETGSAAGARRSGTTTRSVAR